MVIGELKLSQAPIVRPIKQVGVSTHLTVKYCIYGVLTVPLTCS